MVKAAALATFGAFAASFALPVYGESTPHLPGFKVAGIAFDMTFGLNSSWLDRANWGPLALVNLLVLLVLARLAFGHLGKRIPLWAAGLVALCLLDSTRLVTGHYLIGFWVWWACQMATLGLALASRGSVQAPSPAVPHYST
jgi:hypothetical protein